MCRADGGIKDSSPCLGRGDPFCDGSWESISRPRNLCLKGSGDPDWETSDLDPDRKTCEKRTSKVWRCISASPCRTALRSWPCA